MSENKPRKKNAPVTRMLLRVSAFVYASLEQGSQTELPLQLNLSGPKRPDWLAPPLPGLFGVCSMGFLCLCGQCVYNRAPVICIWEF